jgi:BirA family biotin operon repressor/biotin-[acetyl-CoA-carboxylase] ligase
MPRYILLHETASTNTYLSRMASILPSGTVIYTTNQSAGRGQRGNSWESEPGKNVTFSILIKNPAVEIKRQFYISEAVSVAITEVLSKHAPCINIKWPNDIYYNDSKLCGILIENSLLANAIDYTIIGIGINVNQEKFVSDAPNPISLKNITGETYDVETILHEVCECIEQKCDFSNASDSDLAVLHSSYLNCLYRFDGNEHEFALPDGTHFNATIVDVKPDGMFCLRHSDGTEHQYAFKEVIYII